MAAFVCANQIPIRAMYTAITYGDSIPDTHAKTVGENVSAPDLCPPQLTPDGTAQWKKALNRVTLPAHSVDVFKKSRTTDHLPFIQTPLPTRKKPGRQIGFSRACFQRITKFLQATSRLRPSPNTPLEIAQTTLRTNDLGRSSTLIPLIDTTGIPTPNAKFPLAGNQR